MKCENCCYYWTDEDMKYSTCHWGDNPYDSLEMSPCEREEYESDREDYDQYVEEEELYYEEVYDAGL